MSREEGWGSRQKKCPFWGIHGFCNYPNSIEYNYFGLAGVPGLPGAPGDPGAPGAPAAPVSPVEPVAPEEPDEPVCPVAPVAPAGPGVDPGTTTVVCVFGGVSTGASFVV